MRVLIASDKPADRDTARQVALGLGLECGSDDAVALADARGRLASPEARGVVLVDMGADPDPALGVVGDLASVGSLVYAIGPVTDAKLLHRALTAGARGYLNRSELRDELSRTVDGLQKAGIISLKRGAVAAVVGAQPGVGVTTAAAGLAFALARDKGAVGLVELTPTVPALAANLDLKVSHSVGELVRDPGRLDAMMVKYAAVKHALGVDVIAYPAETADADVLTAPAGRGLQVLLRSAYDWSVLDLGLARDPGALELLRLADVVLVVARPDVPNIKLTRQFVKRLATDGVPADRLKVVVNRSGQSGELHWKKVQEALKAPPAGWLTDDPGTVNKAMNLGQPVTGGRLGRRLRDLARTVKATAPARK